MSIPTLTIITGLPNSGQEEYFDNMAVSIYDKYVIPAIPQICEDLRKGKDVVFCTLADPEYIKYDKRKEFMNEIIAKMDHPDSVRFDIVICVRSHTTLTTEDFQLLYNFEFPIKEEGFENIIIEVVNSGRTCNNDFDDIMYKWPAHTKVSNAMKQCGHDIGYVSGSSIYDIGKLYREVYDLRYMANIGAYIVAGNINSIKLTTDPKADYAQKLNMIFLVNYQDYHFRYKLKDLIERFGAQRFKMLMNFDTITDLMN